MAEKPILFSGLMVRAILDGKKTVTRRIVKNYPLSLPRFPFGKIGDRLWVRETFQRPYAPSEFSCGCIYRADGPEYLGLSERGHSYGAGMGWSPSIHMPRKCCRLVLTVTDVRVEPLQKMNCADAGREGFGFGPSAYRKFQDLWDQLNAKRGDWASNPWVWVINFKVGDG